MRLGDVKHSERQTGPKPLADVRILAVEQMQAMPYGTQLLTHLGAQVVKIEPPGRGDSGRASRPTVEEADGNPVGATFIRNNLSYGRVSERMLLKQSSCVFRFVSVFRYNRPFRFLPW